MSFGRVSHIWITHVETHFLLPILQKPKIPALAVYAAILFAGGVLFVISFSEFYFRLCLSFSFPTPRGARRCLLWGNWYSSPAYWGWDGPIPCDRAGGRAAATASKSRARFIGALHPVLAFHAPVYWRPWNPHYSLGFLLDWKGLICFRVCITEACLCVLYHHSQMLSINIYRLCYTASCVYVYGGKKMQIKWFMPKLATVQKLNFSLPISALSHLWIGDFVTGFRAWLWLFRKHPFNKSYGEQLPLSAEPRHIR